MSGRDRKPRGSCTATGRWSPATATFVADVSIPGQLHARVVRSPLAHARARRRGRTEAARLPGVAGVFTAADVGRHEIPIRLAVRGDRGGHARAAAAARAERVRYVGEPVAVVLAEDPWIAEDAAELVGSRPRSARRRDDIVTAASPDAPVVHAALGGNVVNRCLPTSATSRTRSPRRRRRAPYLRLARQTASPLETRGLVAEPIPTAPSRSGGRQGQAFQPHGDCRGAGGAARETSPRRGRRRWRIRRSRRALSGGRPHPPPRHAGSAARPLDRRQGRAFRRHKPRPCAGPRLRGGGNGGRTLLAFRAEHWVDQGAYVRTQGILPTLLPASHLPAPTAGKPLPSRRTA